MAAAVKFAMRVLCGAASAELHRLKAVLAASGVQSLGLLCVAATLALPATVKADEQPLQIMASIRPLALLVNEVTGDAADVEVLLPGGASPHHYSMRVSDMRRLNEVDLVVWLGPDFERFLANSVGAKSGKRGGAGMALGQVQGMHWPESEGHGNHSHNDHADSGRDMHLWLSPENARVALRAIATRLSELRPQQAATFAENLAEAELRLETATEALVEALEPLKERPFGVSHDGFGHFVDYFGLNQVAAVSALPDQGLSARHMAETATQLEQARCLLVERGEPNASTQRLQRALNVRVVHADPLALDPAIGSYPEFLAALGRSFRECLE